MSLLTLYIDHPSAQLEFANGAVYVRGPEGQVRSFPPGLLRSVVISSNIQLQVQTLAALSLQQIGITIFHPRRRAWCLVHGPLGGNALRRLAQYQAAMDPQRRGQLATLLVRLKVHAQLRIATEMLGVDRAARHAFLKARDFLAQSLANLKKTHYDIHSLLGLEGACAAAYFSAYAELFPASLNFSGRNRRPPRDPVNAVLSLSSVLLHAEAVQTAVAASFDPAIGFLHGAAYGRPSLACDLVEPLRAPMERFVWSLFRERILRKEHFQSGSYGCLLGKAGRQAFYQEWDRFRPQVARRMKRMVGMLARALEPVVQQISAESVAESLMEEVELNAGSLSAS